MAECLLHFWVYWDSFYGAVEHTPNSKPQSNCKRQTTTSRPNSPKRDLSQRPLSQARRRLAAIMFTDMVGHIALGQKNESRFLALVEEQRKLVRPILNRHNGREVKTMGDAFLVEFRSALDAVGCAYDIQRATREFNISLPEEQTIRLRTGVHLGDVVESEGRDFGRCSKCGLANSSRSSISLRR